MFTELCTQVGPNLPEAVRKADGYLSFAERICPMSIFCVSNAQEDSLENRLGYRMHGWRYHGASSCEDFGGVK